MIPKKIQTALEGALGVSISDSRAVHGGDINRAARVTFDDGERCLLKWKQGEKPEFFRAEAHGLRTLASAKAIRIPEVLAVGDETAFLAIEWIESGTRNQNFAERFGQQLAELHRHEAELHGLDRDNYIGAMPQVNTQSKSWTAFYREQRIGAQMEFARQRGHLPRQREAALTKLQTKLDNWLDDESTPPALLHGDLWGGNYMIDTTGSPVLIDPAVYYGDRETDLAMSELFGGFPRRLYEAYNEAYPLAGYETRRELYQLYHVLNHMNLFGVSYAGQVDRIVRRYVG